MPRNTNPTTTNSTSRGSTAPPPDVQPVVLERGKSQFPCDLAVQNPSNTFATSSSDGLATEEARRA